MNRRCRSSSSSSSSSSPKREEGFYRYLKPGALAQLRDSRISARSQRRGVLQKTQISLYRLATAATSSATPTVGNGDEGQNQIGGAAFEGFPCFSGRLFNPRFPQRKKLVASRSIYFLSSSPSSPVNESNDNNSIMDVFSNTDLVVSH